MKNWYKQDTQIEGECFEKWSNSKKTPSFLSQLNQLVTKRKVKYGVKQSKPILQNGPKLLQEAHIILREETQIFDLVFKHGDSLDTHAKSKSGVFR